MATRKGANQVLGLMVTSRAVHAVLLERGSDGLRVVRRFMRPRTGRLGTGTSALPDVNDQEGGNDFSLQFSEGGADNMFLTSEFGSFEAGTVDMAAAQRTTSATFVLELSDILAECRDAGYVDPLVAFCLGDADVNHLEVWVPESGSEASSSEPSVMMSRSPRELRSRKQAPKERKPAKEASRSQLLSILKQQHQATIVDETVAFLPMTRHEEGGRRYLAVFPKRDDPVAATVRMMRDEDGRRMPSVRLLDTETSLYLGLARATLNLSTSETIPGNAETRNTLIVRAGAEDTLVLFLEGDRLHQNENLRSLTAYESPETICSRVLLLQDEYAIGDVHHVLLLSEEREDDLIDSFEMFFPDARVESLRRYVPQMNDTKEIPPGVLLPAVGVGLRLSGDPRYDGVFEEVNLLPRQLLRRRVQMPITWHVLALFVLLFCSVLFFTARYFSNKSEIAEHHQTIQELQAASGGVDLSNMDAKTLQARIDSMQALHARYMRALQVLDNLLRGSDVWSRALEETSREVGTVSAIWIEQWQPGGGGLQLEGNSMSRDNVVQLAERLDASIVSLTFSEIREWPVYSFKMQVPLENQLPEAAQFLRDQVAAEQAPQDSVPVTSVSLPRRQ